MFGTNTKDYLRIKFGQIQNTDFKILVNEWINDLKRNQRIFNKLSKQDFKSEEKGKLEGIGGFINPSIWIGKKTLPDLISKYNITLVNKYIDIVINQNYKNRKLIVKTDGYISLFLNSEKIKPKEFPNSKKIFCLINSLNEILSILLLFGFNVTSVESSDF